MPFSLQGSSTELLSMIAWSMCMLGHPMNWYVQKEALSKSSKNISFTDDSASHYTVKPFFCYVGPFLWCIDENRNEKIRSSLVFTAAITSGLPPAHTSISRETVDFSCCITNLLPRKQERAKKKKKSSMTSNFQAVKTTLTGISAVFWRNLK